MRHLHVHQYQVIAVLFGQFNGLHATRMAHGTEGTYQTAGTRLAVETGAPVVPIAVATARCWPKQGFVKYPASCACRSAR